MKHLTTTLVTLFLYNHVESIFTDICDSQIYCQGKLLHTIQMAKLFKDSKTFVDMSQKNPSEVTLQHFDTLMKEKNNNPSRDDLSQFVQDNFESSGELVDWVPSDLKKNPKILKKIKDPKIKEFVQSLINIWPILARKVNSSVAEHPDQHSLITLPNGFIIPGGRFKEIYYWDSYWIVKGLLISEMTDTVRGILENFLSLIEKFGFIPNGSRIYYLNRSQPPLFSHMVGLYIDATNDKAWLEKHVDTIEKELNWWWSNRRIQVQEYDMFMYKVNSNTPRPESYAEDVTTCGSLPTDNKDSCYINMKSGAESGWDYSTRWLFNNDRTPSTNLSMIDIEHVVPADLNAFLCKSFEDLARFYELVGNTNKSSFWSDRHNTLKSAIQDVLYNVEDGIWFDYDLVSNKQTKGFYPSNFAPLWSDAYDVTKKDEYGLKAAQYFKKNKIQRYLGGVPTSLINSGQQWDLPNAWPPLQDLIVLGLKKTGVRKAKKIAELEARITVDAYMKGFDETKAMFEKYDALIPGGFGGGGEYAVQAGFGWTNGAALHFINEFYTTPDKKHKKNKNKKSKNN